MGKEITQLKPYGLWNKFYELTQIPRPSGHEEEVLNFVENFGRSNGIEVIRNGNNSIILRKQATKGYENRKCAILQAHLDMVPQKNSDKQHDFTRDAIETIIDGIWLHANGTTLGADNGIGAAAALAILADNSIPHGPIEVLLTTEEETGMVGAFALQPNILNGSILLNLDSEQEGELCIGGAGGLDATAIFPISKEETAEDDIAFCVSISGLCGGHSGIDIHLGRANANKLLFRFLKFAAATYESMVADICGGSLRNAIPREANAIITIDKDDEADFIEAVEEFEDMFRDEYSKVEPNLSFTAERVEKPTSVFSEMTTDDIINAVQGCPNGVIRMSDDMPNLVETSTNMASIVTTDKQVEIRFLIRSSIDSAKEDVASSIESVCRLAGAEVEMNEGYPGWKPNIDSEILRISKSVFKSTFGTEAKVTAMHAGLECGILAGAYPYWDMISFGPTLKYPHSPAEKVDIASVERFWTLLTEILKAIPEK